MLQVEGRYNILCVTRFFSEMYVIRILLVIVIVGILAGCGALSATSLRCGTDGDTSYVEVVSAPQSLSQNTRALSELCAFAYEGDDGGTET